MKIILRTHLFFCLFLCFMSFTTPALGRELVMGALHLRPWAYISSSDQQQGVNTDLAKELQRVDPQLKINPKLASFYVLNHSLSSGRVDFTILSGLKDENANVEYLLQLGTMSMVALSHEDISIVNAESLAGLRVGFLRGASVDELLFDPSTKRVEASRFETLLVMLENRTVDVVLVNSYQVQYARQLLTDDWSRHVFSRAVFIGKQPVWVVFSKRSRAQSVKPRLKAAFETLILEDVPKKILANYGLEQ